LTKEVKVQRLLSEIQLVSDIKYKAPELYTWGLNNWGQLALNSEHTNITFPKKSLLPSLPKNDNIKEVKFGNKNTLCQTEQGKVYITLETLMNESKKVKKVVQQENMHNILSDDEDLP